MTIGSHNAIVNPFADGSSASSADPPEPQLQTPDGVLTVGKNVTLTLGTDALIVSGMSVVAVLIAIWYHLMGELDIYQYLSKQVKNPCIRRVATVAAAYYHVINLSSPSTPRLSFWYSYQMDYRYSSCVADLTNGKLRRTQDYSICAFL